MKKLSQHALADSTSDTDAADQHQPQRAARGSQRFSSRLRYWATVSGVTIPAALLVLFVFLWLVRRDPLPTAVRVATAHPGQSYHVFGTDFSDAMNKQFGRKIASPIETSGSAQNIDVLHQKGVELALYQGGTFPLKDCGVVAPLYPEVVHVLADRSLLEGVLAGEARRANASLLRQLAQTNPPLVVYAGSANSGMRQSAEEILIEHYGIAREAIEFAKEPDADVVISTTGIFSDAMEKRLASGRYGFLALDADSISQRHRHFSTYTIPKGLYGYERGVPMPSDDVPTVATMAYLVARQDASPKLVLAALTALYESDLQENHSDVVSRYDAKPFLPRMPMHETARDYYYPFDVGATAAMIEAIAGTKELVVALGAGVFLLWGIRKRRREQQHAALLETNRDCLNRFVDQTLQIEQEQLRITDPGKLDELLAAITRIKLRALDELTDEEVRGDRMFSIFLAQCANLISTMQLKIMRYSDENMISSQSEQSQRRSAE
jgi:TRAP-type uncharacterized transport system substrate-binding protein